MTASTPEPCPACGTPAAGRFCSQCGASLVARACESCDAPLSPQARFCHRCGRAAGAGGAGAAGGAAAHRSERSAWIFAGAMCVLLVGAIAYKVLDERPAPVVPSMANPGSAAPGAAATGAPALPPEAGPAPDISRMTPRERFDRLFNRVMQAAERLDTAEAIRFTPMALGAYAQLDTVDADARYHAAVLLLQTGEAGAAAALADTILAEAPGHLFGHMVRGEAARLRGDQAALARARREFLASFPAETAARRPEYADHAPAVEAFKREAEGP